MVTGDSLETPWRQDGHWRLPGDKMVTGDSLETRWSLETLKFDSKEKIF
jgi:hypothetical protein